VVVPAQDDVHLRHRRRQQLVVHHAHVRDREDHLRAARAQVRRLKKN
jgi:hypothetical protein